MGARRERIASRARILRRELFLDLRRDPSHAALVLGSGRGGTTWLAESIAAQFGSRLLFEPFHPVLGPERERMRLFAGPDEGDQALAEAADRLLSGRVRSVHVDQVLCARLARGRVVKDVHAGNLLPWLRTRYPGLPIVFVVRNPIATSLSRLRSGSFYGLGAYLETPAGRADAEGSPAAEWLPLYDRWQADEEPLVRLIAEWCLENAYPLRHAEASGAVLAFYETIVLDPEGELARLAEACRGALGAARAPLSAADLRKPSAMDWFGTAAGTRGEEEWRERLSRWTGEVEPAVLARCRDALAEFGLDDLYRDHPLPVRFTPE
jgi:hypothetical protein